MSEFLLTSVDINKNMGLVLCFFKYLITSAGFRTMLAGGLVLVISEVQPLCASI